MRISSSSTAMKAAERHLCGPAFSPRPVPNGRTPWVSGTHVAWPVGIGAKGNEGVAELVKKTENSIGYVELTFAIQHQLNYAAVKNAAGQFIKADLASITAAATSAASTANQGPPLSILNAPGKNAYPISTFTWIMVPEQVCLTRRSERPSRTCSTWMLTSGTEAMCRTGLCSAAARSSRRASYRPSPP